MAIVIALQYSNWTDNRTGVSFFARKIKREKGTLLQGVAEVSNETAKFYVGRKNFEVHLDEEEAPETRPANEPSFEAPSVAEPPFDPSEVRVIDLEDRLADVSDIAEVRALAEIDERSSAAPLYARRIVELSD